MQPQGMSEESRCYASLDHKPYDSVYRLFETLIDSPVARVWPHALAIRAWMSDHRLETVSGEPGRVGHFERVYPRDVGAEVPLPHYHVYGLAEIIPHRLIALEVLNENGGSYGETREKFGFDSILLVDMGEKTKLIFFMIDVYTSKSPVRDATAQQRHDREERELYDRVYRYFDNLKRNVASDDRRASAS